MKANLLICFLCISMLAFGKKDRETIKKIDDINSSALSFYNNKEIVKSFKEFIKARALSDSIQDHYGYAIANYNLGNIYSLMENYKSAEESYWSALEALKAVNDNDLVSGSYFSLGKIYKEKKEQNKAIEYFEEALKYTLINEYQIGSDNKQIQNLIFDIRINLAELYIDKNNLEQALINLLKIQEYLKTEPVNKNIEGCFKYIYGIYYARKELFNSANNEFKEAIALLETNKEGVDLSLLTKVYMQLSISLAKSGKSAEAYLTLLEHNKYKEQLIDEKKLEQAEITKSKLLIEDYKNNASLANIERLEQLEIANRIKKINGIIIISLILLLISVVTIYIGYVSKRRLSRTLKERNNELEKAKDEALKSSELKTKFISNVSHELRTPLYGVVGITSLLLDSSNLNNRDRKYLKSLKYSGDYLLNLINDILQVGKMESDKVELQNVSVNLERLLEDIANSFEYRLVETNNKIKIIIDNHVPEHIICDNVRLSQVLINLIGNSIKFTTNGTINLRVVLLSLDTKNVGLRFEVEDNGIGIPKEKFDSIFDNFSQLKDSNVNYQGTGLGLSITKNLVELFNSKIDLKSTEGVGTTFSFEVDFEIDQQASQTVSNYENSRNNLEEPKEKYEILIAEDNKINQVVTKNLLEKKGYSCTIVQNGKEALQEVSSKNYDLVLMDINMPVMSGNEATQAIREFNAAIPIIALTAADIDEIKLMYKGVGYTDVVIKPFDNYEFFQVIATHIQNYKGGRLNLIKAS
ncbi:ATP-binding protein [Flavobacteriaceae bacterium SZ-1-7]|uniref:ATP-binding protein n=1 Tax=Tamlana sedimenti TaxID=3134126 RepID=UPI0031253E1C